MATFKKIPKEVRAIGAVAIEHYAIFCPGILKAGRVFTELTKQEKKKDLPMVGYIKLGDERVYYCRYGLVDDPGIYE